MSLGAIPACDMGNGSDRPAVVTTKCVQLYFGMSWMRFDRSKTGLLAANVARFRDDEAEIEPGRLVWRARSTAVCASGRRIAS